MAQPQYYGDGPVLSHCGKSAGHIKGPGHGASEQYIKETSASPLRLSARGNARHGKGWVR